MERIAAGCRKKERERAVRDADSPVSFSSFFFLAEDQHRQGSVWFLLLCSVEEREKREGRKTPEADLSLRGEANQRRNKKTSLKEEKRRVCSSSVVYLAMEVRHPVDQTEGREEKKKKRKNRARQKENCCSLPLRT